MMSTKLKASLERRLIACETMNVEDPYPAHISSNEAVRKIKSDAILFQSIEHERYK